VATRSSWLDLREQYGAVSEQLKAVDQQIKQAEAQLKELEIQQASSAEEIERQIAAQTDVVAMTKKGSGPLIGSYGAVDVYEWWIKVPGGSGPIKGARASVSRVGALTTYNNIDIQVKKKGGLGGAVVGGLAFGPAGAVVGTMLRRKTEVKTTNTPQTQDTRQELVEITGKGFAYTAVFSGWGTGLSLANEINRRSAVKTTPKQELPKREAQLAKLKATRTSSKQVGNRAANAAAEKVDDAWQRRKTVFTQAKRRWTAYADARPSLLQHLALTCLPLPRNGAFSVLSFFSVAVGVSAGVYSAVGSIPSVNPADIVAGLSAVSFAATVVHARKLPPRNLTRATEE